MSTNLTTTDNEIASVFSRALPLIDLTLRREYRLPKQHAEEVEQDVYVWFRRFSMRPAGVGAIESLRPHLFWATCKAARDYWVWSYPDFVDGLVLGILGSRGVSPWSGSRGGRPPRGGGAEPLLSPSI